MRCGPKKSLPRSLLRRGRWLGARAASCCALVVVAVAGATDAAAATHAPDRDGVRAGGGDCGSHDGDGGSRRGKGGGKCRSAFHLTAVRVPVSLSEGDNKLGPIPCPDHFVPVAGRVVGSDGSDIEASLTTTDHDGNIFALAVPAGLTSGTAILYCLPE